MLLGPKIAVIGAGSLRAGVPILASLANLPLAPETRLSLHDEHDEALDLFERLARVFAATNDLELSIQAADDLDHALDGASVAILAFGLGKSAAKAEAWMRTCRDASLRIATMVRATLLHPKFEVINEWLYGLEAAPILVNLVSPAERSSQLLTGEAFHLDWPPPLGQDRRVSTAHQVLRWIRGDDLPYEPLKTNAESPLVSALLDAKPAPENRFNSQALATWMAELAAACPGCAPEALFAD
ncbi:MAG: hypothetical protein H0W86_07165 [Armatimonadetes bacterium]|nr:hypothetical protein [Armatimonadota bacterium]